MVLVKELYLLEIGRAVSGRPLNDVLQYCLSDRFKNLSGESKEGRRYKLGVSKYK
jgi:hypothetical protein